MSFESSSKSWLGSLTHDGEACNATSILTTAEEAAHYHDDHAHEETTTTSNTFVWGVALSMVADAFIAIALCVQKYAHNSNKDPKSGKPIKPFVQLPFWWVGILMNIFGEAGNAYAYSLAPASVVAPVGSVSVVVNEIIAVVFLKEPLRRRDLLGLACVIGGVVLVIMGVPETAGELSVHHILSDEILFNPACYWWLVSLMLLILLFTCYLEPRFAQEWILVWLLLCSSISSVTVAACRSFFSLVNQVPADCTEATCVHGVLHPPCTQTLGHYLFWVLLLVIIVTAVWSAMYLNKAMMVYGNTEVVPVYYCTFTVFSILGGALIYNELAGISVPQGLMFGFGILLAFGGVAILMSGRKPDLAHRKLDLAVTSSADGAHAAAAESGLSASAVTVGSPGNEGKAAAPVSPSRRSSPLRSPSLRGLARQLTGGTGFEEVEVAFRDLGDPDKLEVLENQNVHTSLLCGGIGSSFQQASNDFVLATDRPAALLRVQTANYPGSLSAARRLRSKGRLNESSFLHYLNEKAVAALAAMSHLGIDRASSTPSKAKPAAASQVQEVEISSAAAEAP